MTRTPVQLFQDMEPPQGLFSAILARIERARRRALRFRLATFTLLAGVSAVVLIPVIQYAVSEFYTSGFYEFASLFFDSLTQGYWKDLLYSLIDATPSLALLLLIAIGSVFVWSLRRLRRDVRVSFSALPA